MQIFILRTALIPIHTHSQMLFTTNSPSPPFYDTTAKNALHEHTAAFHTLAAKSCGILDLHWNTVGGSRRAACFPLNQKLFYVLRTSTVNELNLRRPPYILPLPSTPSYHGAFILLYHTSNSFHRPPGVV